MPPSLFLVRDVVEDESSPLHPTEKNKSMGMGRKVMANSLSPYWGVGVEDESPTLHPIEKEQGMGMVHKVMANSPSSYL